MLSCSQWERYVACEPRPNAEGESELNSFVNAWLLDAASVVDELQPLPSVVSAAASAASVLDDLAFAAAGARAANDARLEAQCARFTGQLRALAIEQVELATARVLQFADEYADASAVSLSTISSSSSGANANANRGEVRLSSAEGGVALGLWVNLLAKSGRGKKVDFGEAVGVAVDLPKAILLQSLALRTLHWPFDHLSPPFSDVVALGGLFAVELLAIPAPPKRARGWVMRELPDSSAGSSQQHTKRLHYPLEGMVASAALPIKVSVLQMLWLLVPSI
jgi:cancer susceptibility candidate protein 1